MSNKKLYVQSVAKFEDGSVDSPLVMELDDNYHNMVAAMVPEVHSCLHAALESPGNWQWKEYNGVAGRVQVGYNVFEIPDLAPVL